MKGGSKLDVLHDGRAGVRVTHTLSILAERLLLVALSGDVLLLVVLDVDLPPRLYTTTTSAIAVVLLSVACDKRCLSLTSRPRLCPCRNLNANANVVYEYQVPVSGEPTWYQVCGDPIARVSLVKVRTVRYVQFG